MSVFQKRNFSGVMRKELNGFNVLDRVQELSLLIERYDQADRESDIALFSEHDPLTNIKRGLAEKISSSTGKTLAECQVEAEEIVNQIKQNLMNPDVKSRICSSLKLLSDDLSNLSIGVVSAVLATLVTGGVLVFPILPALPEISIAVGGFILTRAGIEFICSDKN